jgi:glutathione synthase/RimK-type ligase-like ATP-grasp enzyme
MVGADVAMAPFAVPDEIGHRLVAPSRSIGLLVSGADLRLTPDGDWVCFEVNPSPGFTFYEDDTGQPISAAIADLVIGEAPT